MHEEVYDFGLKLKTHFPVFFTPHSVVLEIGSRNINGSLRGLFPPKASYLGIDLSQGPGVDLIIHATQLPLSFFEGIFTVVYSTEALEHDVFFSTTMTQMLHVLTPGGLLFFTCAGPSRAEHGTARTSPEDSPMTLDHYQNLTLDDVQTALPRERFTSYHLAYARSNNDLQFWGIKK